MSYFNGWIKEKKAILIMMTFVNFLKKEEEKLIQENKKRELTEKEARHSEELKQIQQNISKVESGIIECKKKYQYLDKCKFVLDYKIKELKKEIGPIEKMIEELKKQTSTSAIAGASEKIVE